MKIEMADFCGFLSQLSENRKKIKISLKKRLTFLEVQFIVYGLSKLGHMRKWNLTSGMRKESAIL